MHGLPHDFDWPLPARVPCLSALEAKGAPADAEQIEKDLHRAGCAEEHRGTLRRLLRAWCWSCDGYSQSMSHVGASLIAVAPDIEGAFCSFAWLLSALPANYFDDGHRVEARALRILAARRWPEVVEPALYEALELVATQWLLGLWAGVLPPPCCMSVWAQMTVDFCEDDEAPADTSLRVALALLATALVEIHEAAEADAREEEGTVAADGGAPSVGCASYAALQQAAQWEHDARTLIDAARSFELPRRVVSGARAAARFQLEAEEGTRRRELAAAREQAAERERRERERARAFGPLPECAPDAARAHEAALALAAREEALDPVLQARRLLLEFEQT